MTQPIGSESFPYFGDEHTMLRATIRRFIAERVLPAGDHWEEQGYVPRQILTEMGALGLLGMRYAPEYGGSGLDTLANAVLAEELGRSTYGGFAVTVLVHTDMASPHLYHAGSKAQLERWMRGITAGRTITAIAMTEPDAGSDLASMRSTARKTAGGYCLNGAKTFITNGVHAELVFVAANTGEPGRGRHLTMFAVEKGTPGFRVARTLKKQGWLSSDTAELVFEDCFVPDENVLGEEGRGFYQLVKNLQNERIVLAAQALGEAMKALELTLDWVKQRKAFGGPLWISRRSDNACRCAAPRWKRPAPSCSIPPGAMRGTKTSSKRYRCSRPGGTLVNEVMYDCLQFHGGMGYMRETAIERMTRDARVQAIGGGATEVMLEEVAKRI